MPYGEESAYAAQAALKKKSPAYKKSSGFKMKGSPLHDHETGPDGKTISHPELPTSEAHSTSVAPVVEPIVTDPPQPTTTPGEDIQEPFGLMKTFKKVKKKKTYTKDIGKELRKKYGH